MQQLKIYDYSNLEFDCIIREEQNQWRRRTAFLIESVVCALVEMNNKQEITINDESVNKYLFLKEIIHLSNRQDFAPETLNALKKHLNSLPGFDKNGEEQKSGVIEQHYYLRTQFIDPKTQQIDMSKVFQIACLSQKTKTINFFIEHFSDYHTHIQRGFISCCFLGLIDNIKFLLNQPEINIDISKDNNICFKVAFFNNQFFVVNYLMTECDLEICENLAKWIEECSNTSMKEYVQKMLQIQKIKKNLEFQLYLKEEIDYQLIKI